MTVVERRDELDVARQEHAVAEDVAGHVADARDGEVDRLRVDAHFAEVALDRLPGAAGGDAHRLVVVSRGAARGKRIPQPEIVFPADAVRVIGKCRRAFVGCDDQIRIVGVLAFDLRRRNDLVADAVVGDVEQAAQIILVTGDPFLEKRFAIGRRRRALEHEAALGAHRHDDGVLDHLRLDQPKHFGPEIFRPVRPAQPSARDLAAAQVHALEPRRVDEDLEHRLRLRQARHLRGVELERYEAPALPSRVAAPVIRAGRPENQREVLAKHAILGKVLHLVERRLDRAHLFCGPGPCARTVIGIEAGLEQLDQHAGEIWMRSQRCLDESLRQCKSDLPQVFCVSAQQGNFMRWKTSGDDEAIEVVVLDLSIEYAAERILEHRVQGVDLDFGIRQARKQPEIVNPDGRRAVRRDAVWALVQHLESHVLEHRQAVGQRYRAAEMEQLEAQCTRRSFERPVQSHGQRRGFAQLGHRPDIRYRIPRGEILAISRGKRGAKAAEVVIAARFAGRFDQRLLEIVLPSPRRGGEARLELAHVEGGNVARRGAHGDQDPRQSRLRQVHIELGAAAVECLGQDRLPFLPQLGRICLARSVNEA